MNKRELKQLIKECIKEIAGGFDIINIEDDISATLIKVDTAIKIQKIIPRDKKKFSINELKEILGGEIDIIYAQINNYPMRIVYNKSENAKQKNFNSRATDLFGLSHKKNFFGDILICKGNQIKLENREYFNEFIDLTRNDDDSSFNKKAAMLIKASGHHSEPMIQEIFPKMVKFSEEELKKILGGDIYIRKITENEMTKIFNDHPDIKHLLPNDIFLVIRKDQHNLNPNNFATDMLAKAVGQLRGDVLLCRKNQINLRYHA